MRNTLKGWTITPRGGSVDAHLITARKQRPCSPSAHYAANDIDRATGLGRRCGQTVEPGAVYVAVRTGAWPDADSPMAATCAELAGLVTR
jgi:hypothetical protein